MNHTKMELLSLIIIILHLFYSLKC